MKLSDCLPINGLCKAFKLIGCDRKGEVITTVTYLPASSILVIMGAIFSRWAWTKCSSQNGTGPKLAVENQCSDNDKSKSEFKHGENVEPVGNIGQSMQDLTTVFDAFASKGVLEENMLKSAFQALKLSLTPLQVEEALYTSASSRGAGDDEAKFVTRGEFNLLALEVMMAAAEKKRLTAAAKAGIPPSPLQQRGAKDQVFLGGACNPTTWRQDIAIPFLKEKGISFFNPQVKEWNPSLVNLEAHAKMDAKALLFVIDNCTRSIASMVEVSYLIGCERPVILCMLETGDPDSFFTINGEEVSPEERDELKMSRLLLAETALRSGYPLFRSLRAALHATAAVVHGGVAVRDLVAQEDIIVATCPALSLGQMLLRITGQFHCWDAAKNGFISPDEAMLLHQSLFQAEPDKRPPGVAVSREEFFLLAASHMQKTVQRSSESQLGYFQRLQTAVVAPFEWFTQWLVRPPAQGVQTSRERSQVVDALFAGSFSDSWREDVAEPRLRRAGVTWLSQEYATPHQLSKTMSAHGSCRITLCIITENRPGTVALMEAAYLIGRGLSLVLYVENIRIGDGKHKLMLSERAVRDYNRGRTYLRDVANQHHVPSTSCPNTAVDEVLSRLKEHRKY